MLVSNRSYMINPPLTFVKEELKLALTKKGEWKFLDDLKETEELVQVKTFSFGNCYGIIHHKETEKSCIKIKGITWYVVTDKKTNMPVLKNQEVYDCSCKYLDLKLIDYNYSIFQ